MRIGIIRLSALGDIIVAMSFLPFLKEHQIDWFIDSRFEEIAKHSPYIHTLHSLPLKHIFKTKNSRNLFSQIQRLKSLPPYDLLIDMQGLLKSAILGKFIPKKQFRGFGFTSSKESLASLFYQEKIHIAYEENILKRNAKILNLPLNLPPQNAFGYTPQAQEKITSLLKHSHKKVLLVLEASKPEKMYPTSHFIELCKISQQEKIHFFVLYHQFKSQALELCSHTQATLLPLLGLNEVKALVHQSDAIIGGDTGITHLAWAMNKPSITLYGNTPMQRFKLFGEKNIALSGNTQANYAKNDFSIANISPVEIKKHLLEIL